MSNNCRDIITKQLVDFYWEKDQEKYQEDIIKMLKDLDWFEEKSEPTKQIHMCYREFYKLMGKTGDILLDDDQFYISNILSGSSLVIALLAVCISINSSFSIGPWILAILAIVLAGLSVSLIIQKSRKGKQRIKKQIAVFIKQYESSLETEES